MSSYNFTRDPQQQQTIDMETIARWRHTNVAQRKLLKGINSQGKLYGIWFNDNQVFFKDFFTRYVDNGNGGVRLTSGESWFGVGTRGWTIIDPTSPYVRFVNNDSNCTKMYQAHNGPALGKNCRGGLELVIAETVRLIFLGCPPDELKALFARQFCYLETHCRGALYDLFINAMAMMLDDFYNQRSFQSTLRTRQLWAPYAFLTTNVEKHASFKIHGQVPVQA